MFDRGTTARHILLLVAIMLTAAGCNLPTAQSGVEIARIAGPPEVSLASPLMNATYLQGVNVNIQASVSNAGEDIDRVEINVDGAQIAAIPAPNPAGDPTFSVTQTWPAEAAGSYIISVVAYRTDGSASPPVTTTINVIEELPDVDMPGGSEEEPDSDSDTNGDSNTDVPDQSLPSPTPTMTITSAPPTATLEPSPTDIPATATPAVPMVTGNGVNIRSGPGLEFDPPIGVLLENNPLEVIGTNLDGSWYKIRFGASGGWVFNGVVTVDGDTSGLPREVGPPTPIPPTNTPVPVATAAPTSAGGGGDPSSGVNLRVVGFELRPVSGGGVNNIFINEPAVAFVRVRNDGSEAAGGFFVVLTIVNKDDGGFKLVEAASVNGLGAGQEQLVQIPFTDQAGAGLVKAAVARADENGQIAESNENDNASAPIEYVLGAR